MVNVHNFGGRFLRGMAVGFPVILLGSVLLASGLNRTWLAGVIVVIAVLLANYRFRQSSPQIEIANPKTEPMAPPPTAMYEVSPLSMRIDFPISPIAALIHRQVHNAIVVDIANGSIVIIEPKLTLPGEDSNPQFIRTSTDIEATQSFNSYDPLEVSSLVIPGKIHWSVREICLS